MRSVARVLGYLMAVLIGLAATVIAVLFSVQSPAAAIPVGANVTIHTDDAPGYDAHENYTAPERGPPADLDTTYDPDGPRSLGVLTRPHTPIAPSTHDYDDIAPFVHTAGASQRVEEPDGDPESSHAVVQRLQVAAKSADDFVDLASASRRSHILNGEVRPNGSFGGGHRPGTGFPNKSEFPAGWSDDKIMHSISDVATDPSLIWRVGNKPGDFFVNGTRGGIDIEVLIRNNQIWTGYPTNVIRNAP